MDALAAPRNLALLLAAAAEARPGHPAIVEGARRTDYAALARNAGGIAAALHARGLDPGARVGILLPRGADAAAALFGVWAAGAVAVVINERLRARQLEHQMRDAGLAALISRDEVLARLPRAPADLPPLLAPGVPGSPLVPDALPVDALAQLIYTSGSTGLPKGVMFTHDALGVGVATCAAYLDLRADDRIASVLAWSAVYGLNQLLTAVLLGATLVVESSVLPAQIVTGLAAGGVTVLAAVPPLWLSLLSVPGFPAALPTLRQCQNAGGHLSPEVVRRLRAAQSGADLVLQYGMTETFRSTWLPPGEVDRRPGCMGQAIPGAEILVLRDDGQACGPDEVGELVHAGPTLATGYWRDPAATARVFRVHPWQPATRAVYSGDLVRRDAAGYLWFVSRADRVIKTMGQRVGPDEVADVLHASGLVAEAVVWPEPDPERGERIVASVVLAQGASLAALTRYCRAELPPYMLPARWDARDALPRLASGKYDLAALSAPPA